MEWSGRTLISHHGGAGATSVGVACLDNLFYSIYYYYIITINSDYIEWSTEMRSSAKPKTINAHIIINVPIKKINYIIIR
jgi:hypothetical protein